MTTPILRLNQSAPLQCKKDGQLEQRLETKLSDVISFNFLNNNVE